MLTNAERQTDMIEIRASISGGTMTEREGATERQPDADLETEAEATEAAERKRRLDEHWRKLKARGLVTGSPPPGREERVDPSTMRPIRYHGTNDDLLRDLGRCR